MHFYIKGQELEALGEVRQNFKCKNVTQRTPARKARGCSRSEFQKTFIFLPLFSKASTFNIPIPLLSPNSRLLEFEQSKRQNLQTANRSSKSKPSTRIPDKFAKEQVR